jgi:hypothetical protein
MGTKLTQDPITKKKLRPIIKFNGGRGAILCHKCRKIIKEDLSIKEFNGQSELLFCVDCATEMVKEMFKR